jgi:hypothetical protein
MLLGHHAYSKPRDSMRAQAEGSHFRFTRRLDPDALGRPGASASRAARRTIPSGRNPDARSSARKGLPALAVVSRMIGSSVMILPSQLSLRQLISERNENDRFVAPLDLGRNAFLIPSS